MSNEPDIDLSGSDNTTLSQVLDAYIAGGFAAEFFITPESKLECGVCGVVSDPADVRMSSLRRLEGESDPADMVAVVALTCPACDSGGTMTLGYGPAATAEDGDVLLALRDHRGDDMAPGNSAPGETHGDA
jgi:hypothetical protein